MIVLTGQRRPLSIRHEGGQSLVIIIFAMSMLLAMAAIAIDISQWYTARHQAQVTADSAALAAANCLAFPGNGPAPQCASPGIDQTDAKAVAAGYSANGVTVSTGNVAINTTSYTVTVKANITSGTVFASLFGIGARNITATAVASFTAEPTSCSGASCDFMFADDSNCSNPNAGITIDATNGNVAIAGNIQTNGNLNVAVNGNPTLGTGQYGPGTSCTGPSSSKGWSEAPAAELATTSYPIDYTQDFPACGGTGPACASSGYPTYCTKVQANFTNLTPATDNIYCATGTVGGSVVASDPSTWNGQITLSGGGTTFDTFVGGTITYDIGDNHLSACGYQQPPLKYAAANCSSSVPTPTTGNYPVFYATAATSTAINLSGSGNGTLSGDVFAGNGTVAIGQITGTPTLLTFIEGYDIVVQKIAGTVTGDGPAAGSSGTGGPPGDSLTQ
jgi:hypothetical protein